MKFISSVAPVNELAVDLLFVPVYGPDDSLDSEPGLDEATGGEIGRARSSGEFRAKLYDVFVTPVVASGRYRAKRIALVGAGPREESDALRVRRVAAACGYAARRRGVDSVAFVVRGADADRLAQHVADGLSAAEFDGGVYKSDRGAAGTYPGHVEVAVPGADPARIDAAVRHGRVIAECANVTRALANEPANILTPREFATRVGETATAAGLAVEVLDERQIRDLGMGLLLAVGQGSAEPPRVIVLRHRSAPPPGRPVLGLIGKGITFDTGGISIKPADGMERMKNDMAGGAAVAGAMCALARLDSPYPVVAVIPTTENMPSGTAIRPGDVVRGASGKSVEIINTDAEGRLILGDGLWYAQRLGATHLVDVATLTGAILVALGRSVSGLFGSDDRWVNHVNAAAARAGDRVWPMPIYEEAREQLRSEIADLINSGGRAGGAVTAAAFLRDFAGGLPWAHLDIAGTAWAESKEAYQPKGATGVAVRLLTALGMAPLPEARESSG